MINVGYQKCFDAFDVYFLCLFAFAFIASFSWLSGVIPKINEVLCFSYIYRLTELVIFIQRAQY